MGNDGGSIPDRRDLVRTKPKAEQADKQNQTRAEWFFCALSKKPLQKPVVGCELGKMYNKDAIVEYLLDKSLYGDGEKICGHIRSLKDVKTLTLTSNPSPTLPAGSDLPFPPFVCPLTMKEMLGSIPFVFLWSCGCVFSKSGLRALSTPAEEAERRKEEAQEAHEGGSDKENKEGKEKADRVLACPQCGKPYTEAQIVPLNPPPAIAEERRAALLLRRASEPAKSKKRKAAAAALLGADEPEGKRAKPALGPTMASSAVAALLREEERKRAKTGMSAAVKSLYRDKDAKEDKPTFLTMGTFTRVSTRFVEVVMYRLTLSSMHR
ncbi:DUF602-domain-containing protein [Calocera viscosa TUFC12733]|uniref:DUF602-domain-containing protein n=1 Tax=Calocera viscosa (strain TUFC12733) TaxID=1330018 RepID=A0A167Q9S2_CALVF|nr:DUF602-domain-containing protein [Calocera viscosa TUFC12733]